MGFSMDPTRGFGYLPILTITGYLDREGDKKAPPAESFENAKIEVAYDPDSFSVNNTLELSQPITMDNPPGGASYVGAKDNVLKVELLFDDTTLPTVVEFALSKSASYHKMLNSSVENKLKKFFQVIYGGSEAQSPNYLEITGGAMEIMPLDPSGSMFCICQSMEVKTKLISVLTGHRIKASVCAEFHQATEPEGFWD